MWGNGSIYEIMKTYLFGRGLMSLAVIAAGMLGVPITPALVVAVGGSVLTGLMRLGAEAHYEQQMVELYRDDLAQRFGIAPEDVTRKHLKNAAKDNEVIAQALHRQERKNTVSFATAALAGIGTFALIFGAGLPGLVSDFFAAHLAAYPAIIPFFKFASTGIVATAASLVLHDGFEAVIGHEAGLDKAAAHDMILTMQKELSIGHTMTPEKVYGVLVAGNPTLQQTIMREFKKTYAGMTQREQRNVLQTIGITEQMQTLADDITNGDVKPGHLAFIIGDAKAMPMVTPFRIAEHVPQLVKTHFVEKFAPARREGRNFTERLAQERAQPPHSPAL